MARAILTLKKVAASALSEMLMGGNGRDLEKIYRSITLLWIELRDSAFSKREGLHM
jgi:flagellar motor switch protein FliM